MTNDARRADSRSADVVCAFVCDSFRTTDKDGSSHIERDEAPEGGLYPDPLAAPALTPPLTVVHGRGRRAMTVAQADTDGDGRIREAEFAPIFIGRGVSGNWRGA